MRAYCLLACLLAWCHRCSLCLNCVWLARVSSYKLECGACRRQAVRALTISKLRQNESGHPKGAVCSTWGT
ncbi:hypothetical protein F4780DRAFT_749788 [Xylariomycetidae sp. FL0641]|nr:hypothetical protein F4780DRAFT_749788 [Xylariomycetidae sp. FL0641]